LLSYPLGLHAVDANAHPSPEWTSQWEFPVIALRAQMDVTAITKQQSKKPETRASNHQL